MFLGKNDTCGVMCSQIKNCTATCGGFTAKQITVCSGHGNCVDEEKCACVDGFTGKNCEIAPNNNNNTNGGNATDFTCFKTPASSPAVCGGKGKCTAQDVCQCNYGWVGPQCLTQGQATFVGKKCNVDTGSCVPHASCRDSAAGMTCQCDNGYVANMASPESATCSPLCNGTAAFFDQVCSGHGSCTAPDLCECKYLIIVLEFHVFNRQISKFF